MDGTKYIDCLLQIDKELKEMDKLNFIGYFTYLKNLNKCSHCLQFFSNNSDNEGIEFCLFLINKLLFKLNSLNLKDEKVLDVIKNYEVFYQNFLKTYKIN